MEFECGFWTAEVLISVAHLNHAKIFLLFSVEKRQLVKFYYYRLARTGLFVPWRIVLDMWGNYLLTFKYILSDFCTYQSSNSPKVAYTLFSTRIVLQK